MLTIESAYAWLLHSALVSLGVLLVGSVAVLLCRQPGRRLQIIGLTLAGCLIAPWLGMISGYPRLPIGWLATQESATGCASGYLPDNTKAVTGSASAALPPNPLVDDLPSTVSGEASGTHVGTQAVVPVALDDEVAPPTRFWNLASWVVTLYVFGVAIGIAWWLAGMVVLLRILRTSQPAPPRCRQLLAEIAGRRSARVRVLVNHRVKQPFASTWWPTAIVLPEDMCNDGGTVPIFVAGRAPTEGWSRQRGRHKNGTVPLPGEQALRWALAHEWTHVERHDVRAWFAAGLVRLLFFYQPLIWWLRRQLRLCQDYVADAQASRQGPQTEDYAEFLTARAVAGSWRPVMIGLGMGARKSELFRRVVMLVEKPPLESRAPRLWTASATCLGLILSAAAATLSLSPQPATGSAPSATGSAGAASSRDARMPGASSPGMGNARRMTNNKSPKPKITLQSLGFARYGAGVDEETEKQRDERISQALTSGRFRLLNLEVMQIHLCRDVVSGTEFKVQRIQRRDGTEIALPRRDHGAIPPSLHETSWQDHLKAIRDGKRSLLKLETVNSYTYEMTADDGTKEIFNYGGNTPLDVLVQRPGHGGTNRGTAGGSAGKTGALFSGKLGETVVGVRPQGDCSISGKVVSAATGQPVVHGRMYLHYNVTHGSIFVHTAKDGSFTFGNIPKGPFSLQLSRSPGYQDVAYNPDGKPPIFLFPPFALKEGEHRSGIVLRAKPACRVSGKVRDENGKIPDGIGTLSVLAWFKKNDAKRNDPDKYESEQGRVNSADGSYLIDGLSGKPVYVMAINWRAAREGHAYPPIYYPSTFSRTDARLITFEKSPNANDINITLRKEGGITLVGTVRDEAGKPVPEAFVVVHHRDMLFDFSTAYTDAQGHYEIHGLGDGKFLVHVDAVQRGFVRTRAPVDIEKTSRELTRDFTLHRGVLISGKLVDENGEDWQIGQSFGNAYVITRQVTKGRQKSRSVIGETSSFSLTNFRNKHRPPDAIEGPAGSFDCGEGDYIDGQMIFSTKSSFIIQGMMPGQTRFTFLPNKEGQKVVKILHGKQDITKSGLDTKPGQEIKDITIVIGKR